MISALFKRAWVCILLCFIFFIPDLDCSIWKSSTTSTPSSLVSYEQGTLKYQLVICCIEV